MRPRKPCQDLFSHLTDLVETRDHDCGHQYDVLPCGCVLVDDHSVEPCDGRTVAELEEAR